jgi:hypothetical protein
MRHLFKYISILLLLIVGFYVPASYSQNPSYNLTLSNAKQVSSKAFEVDIYLQSTSTTTIELASISMGISYNSAIRGKGGTLTALWINSSSQLTNQSELPTALNTATSGVIKIAGKIPPGPGNGSIISNAAPGTKIGRLRITNTARFSGGQQVNFGWLPSNKYPTTINAYVAKVNTNLTSPGASNNTISLPALIPPLPSLASTIQGNTIVLNWPTESILNSDRIDIQKAEVMDHATDETWNTVTSINTADISDTTTEYSYSDNKVQKGKYQYRLKIVENDSMLSYSNVVETAIVALPKDFTLSQNYPNPFNPTTKIDYQVPVDARVILEVYNIAGQKVAEIVNKEQSAGNYSVDFGSAGKLASGVYIYRMNATEKATGINFSAIKKMMLLK